MRDAQPCDRFVRLVRSGLRVPQVQKRLVEELDHVLVEEPVGDGPEARCGAL